MLDKLIPDMVKNNIMSEIGKFGSTELKKDIKRVYTFFKNGQLAYDEICIKDKEKKNANQRANNANETPTNKPITPPVASTSGNEERGKELFNLQFLTELSNVMTLSLTRIYLYYLRNLDHYSNQ